MSIYKRVQFILEGSLGYRKSSRKFGFAPLFKKFLHKQKWRVGITPDNEKFKDSIPKMNKLNKRITNMERNRNGITQSYMSGDRGSEKKWSTGDYNRETRNTTGYSIKKLRGPQKHNLLTKKVEEALSGAARAYKNWHRKTNKVDVNDMNKFMTHANHEKNALKAIPTKPDRDKYRQSKKYDKVQAKRAHRRTA